MPESGRSRRGTRDRAPRSVPDAAWRCRGPGARPSAPTLVCTAEPHVEPELRRLDTSDAPARSRHRQTLAAMADLAEAVVESPRVPARQTRLARAARLERDSGGVDRDDATRRTRSGPRVGFERIGATEGCVKSSAQVVVIGGGVVGASVLYHLTKAGWTDVDAPRATRADGRLDLARRRRDAHAQRRPERRPAPAVHDPAVRGDPGGVRPGLLDPPARRADARRATRPGWTSSGWPSRAAATSGCSSR